MNSVLSMVTGIRAQQMLGVMKMIKMVIFKSQFNRRTHRWMQDTMYKNLYSSGV